jgi:hypothetical protein
MCQNERLKRYEYDITGENYKDFFRVENHNLPPLEGPKTHFILICNLSATTTKKKIRQKEKHHRPLESINCTCRKMSEKWSKVSQDSLHTLFTNKLLFKLESF